MNYGYGGVQVNTDEDFWAKIDVGSEDECWDWLWACFENGYGKFKQNYQSTKAHRKALTLAKGEAPSDRPLALHICNNRKCCNPKHLFWGTHQDNMNMRKDRNIPAHNKGLKLKDGWYQ